MRAAYHVKRYTPHGDIDTLHATYVEAWDAYEAARIESQGGVGLPPRYRIELWRMGRGKLDPKLITHAGNHAPHGLATSKGV
jgi:hypothetical protein